MCSLLPNGQFSDNGDSLARLGAFPTRLDLDVSPRPVKIGTCISDTDIFAQAKSLPDCKTDCCIISKCTDCTVLHCTEPFIIILRSSLYDLNNVGRGAKQTKQQMDGDLTHRQTILNHLRSLGPTLIPDHPR